MQGASEEAGSSKLTSQGPSNSQHGCWVVNSKDLPLTNGILINRLNHLLWCHDKAILCEVHELLLNIKVPET